MRKRRKEDLAVGDDAAALPKDGGVEEDLLADHGVVLVVGVVGVAELTVGPELELQELVTELTLVPHVVPEVELSIVFPGRHLSVVCERDRENPLIFLRETLFVLRMGFDNRREGMKYVTYSLVGLSQIQPSSGKNGLLPV